MARLIFVSHCYIVNDIQTETPKKKKPTTHFTIFRFEFFFCFLKEIMILCMSIHFYFLINFSFDKNGILLKIIVFLCIFFFFRRLKVKSLTKKKKKINNNGIAMSQMIF